MHDVDVVVTPRVYHETSIVDIMVVCLVVTERLAQRQALLLFLKHTRVDLPS